MSGFERIHEITIKIDTSQLSTCSDAHLAALWHVAQANPAPHADKVAGDIAGSIGFEIIRRWLAKTRPELYHHQGRDYYWSELGRLAMFKDGEWVPRTEADAASNGRAEASA